MMKEISRYRELTDDEINALPLDLRCCWYLQPWNANAKHTTVKGWAKGLGAMRYWGEHITSQQAIRLAEAEAVALIAFVKMMSAHPENTAGHRLRPEGARP